MPSYAVPGSQSVQTSEKGRQAVEKKTSEKQREERRGDTYPPLPSSPEVFTQIFSMRFPLYLGAWNRLCPIVEIMMTTI